jgi:hypothetical protein
MLFLFHAGHYATRIKHPSRMRKLHAGTTRRAYTTLHACANFTPGTTRHAYSTLTHAQSSRRALRDGHTAPFTHAQTSRRTLRDAHTARLTHAPSLLALSVPDRVIYILWERLWLRRVHFSAAFYNSRSRSPPCWRFQHINCSVHNRS